MKILLIEDDALQAKLFRKVLEKGAFQVELKTSGEEALRFLGTEDVDLVLLDFVMPGMDGVEVCRRLKSQERFRDLPILFLTALNQPENIATGLRAGAHDYIFKGADPTEIVARVETHLGHARVMRRMIEFEKQLGLGHLVTGVCHELLNPLTILSGNLELLSNTPLETDQKKLIEDSHDLCFRIADQITRLKEYTEGVERPFQEEHLSQIAKQAIDIASIEAHREGVAISFAVEKMPPVQAQRDRLCQAVFNVISNAVTVSVGSEVRVVVGRERGRGFIRIEDTGPGIDPEIQRHIFEPFFSTDPERVGLGLSVTNKIIAEHGGSIEVESIEGRGTSFSLYIPLSEH